MKKLSSTGQISSAQLSTSNLKVACDSCDSGMVLRCGNCPKRDLFQISKISSFTLNKCWISIDLDGFWRWFWPSMISSIAPCPWQKMTAWEQDNQPFDIVQNSKSWQICYITVVQICLKSGLLVIWEVAKLFVAEDYLALRDHGSTAGSNGPFERAQLPDLHDFLVSRSRV